MNRKLFSFALAILIFSSLNAQSILTGTFQTKDEGFSFLDTHLAHYTVFQMDVNKSDVQITSESPNLNLQLGEVSYNLNLYQDNLTTSFENPNKPLLLGGNLASGGLVSLTINDDFIFGFIKQGNSQIYIEPLRHFDNAVSNDLFVVYNLNDVIENGEHVCGSDKVKIKGQDTYNNALKMPTTSCKIIRLAIANTFDMVAAFGGATNVVNFNLGVMNDVQTNYRSEFTYNLEFDVVATYVPTSSSGNPLSPLTSSDAASIILTNFANWAAGGGGSSNTSGGFGLAFNQGQIWTDKDIQHLGNYDVIGLAGTPGWFHVLENTGGVAPSLNVLVSHEMGHNFSCVHVTASTNIMFPSVLLTDNWSTTSVNAINAYIGGQSFLADCSTIAAPTANFFHSIAGCINEDIDFEDQSQYGATRLWDFPNGTPNSSTSEKPSINYNTTGLRYAKVTSTNATGSDDFTSYVDIQAAPPTPCTPTGSGSTGGITNVFLEGGIFSNSNTTGVYEDFSCSQISVLSTSTTYVFSVSLSNVRFLRFFIDFNNDGDFNDTGETSGNLDFGAIITGTYNTSINMPASPVTEEILRMRVIGSTTSIAASGCSTPPSGQVEDYGLYFDGPQVLGCTDVNANNYDAAATIDDGSCSYGSMTWYRDFDMDNYGDPNNSQNSGSQPSGYVADNTDCDDMDSAINPGATEVCDGIDNNCDNQVDEGVLITSYFDNDTDGFGNPAISNVGCTIPSGYVDDGTDCNDNDANEFPGQIWFKDVDGDLWGDGTSISQCTRPINFYVASELSSVDDDCDDDDPTAYPGAPEICDGRDNNCNTLIDEGVLITFYKDVDSDTYGDPNVFTMACTAPPNYVANDLDCDDNDANEFPGQVWYKDADADQYGDGTVLTQCLRPNNYYLMSELIATDTDCDDNDNTSFPGATEICDGVDNDCDTTIDEGCSMPDCDDTFLTIPIITQNEYHAEIGIDSDAMANNGQSILFTAGSYINLNPFFEVQLGTEFEARIENCTPMAQGPEDIPVNGITNPFEEIENGILEHIADKDFDITIYNKFGEILINGHHDKTEINKIIEKISFLEKGFYLIKVNGAKHDFLQRIFVK